MKEKIKNWNWKLIISVVFMLAFLAGYILTVVGLNHPDFAPMRADEYEPTVDCIYGFAVALAAVLLGCFVYNLWNVMDIVWPPKKKEVK